MPHFCDLPFELLYQIVQQLSSMDLAKTRLTSKKIKSICDRPELWRSIQLKPQDDNGSVISFWSLNKLKSILSPHKQFLQRIDIWGVRDDIVQYLLRSCFQLKELTVYGWTTLSDHAFILPQPIHLCRLRLIGERKTNFTSLDSVTFSKFIRNCPQLEEFSIVSCHIHLHAESLIETLYRQHHPPLKYLNIATKQSWSIEHIAKLFDLCSNLSVLGLVPDSNTIIPDSHIPMLDMGKNNNYWSFLKKNYKFIQEEEIVEFNNIILFRQ